MPTDDVIRPRQPAVSVPGGTGEAPWLPPSAQRIHEAGYWLLGYGPELLRMADEPPPPPSIIKKSSRR